MQRFLIGPIGNLDLLSVVLGCLTFEDGGQPSIEGYDSRVRVAKLVQVAFGFGRILRAAQALVGSDQIGQVVGQELPVGRMTRVDRQGLPLPCDGLDEFAPGLFELTLSQVDPGYVVQSGAQIAAEVGRFGMLALSRSRIARACSCDTSASAGLSVSRCRTPLLLWLFAWSLWGVRRDSFFE